MQEKLAIVLRMDERDARTAKLLGTLSAHYRCVVIGWNRFPEPWLPPNAGWEREVLHRPTGEGLANIRHTVRLKRHIRNALDKHRPDLAIAVNEEVGFLVQRYEGRFFKRMVLDIHDELTIRTRSANPLTKYVLPLIATSARDRAARILSTSMDRKALLTPAQQAKTVVAPNYPIDHGAMVWRSLPEGECKLFVGGALSRARGLAWILAAARECGVRILAAGTLCDGYARQFVTDPAVEYHGRLSPEGAMRLLSECDGSVAMYEPGPKVNELASPNKVYDALCAGRPVIVSKEARISSWVEQQGVGCAAPYGDLPALTEVLTRMRENRGKLGDFAKRARELFCSGYSWASLEPLVLSAIDQALKSQN